MFKVKQNDIFAKNMSGAELYQTTKLSKKYTQKPAEIPGAMKLEWQKDVEDKVISQQEYDKWLEELIAKNGITKY
jgi:3-mercaptopyruvate sulfurtransferase SseA|tara:strand:+ start:240 stop:464 length:225 start_codon:yes stop_codon:yes gene_type:complete